MNLLLTVLVPLVEQGPDPEDVKAGWVALAVFLLMGVAIALLAFSLVRNLKKARTNLADENDHTAEENGGDTTRSR